MKITAPIYKNSDLETLLPYVDSVVLMVPHYAYIFDELDLEWALNKCKENKIEAILSIQRVFMEDELKEISNFIDQYKNELFLISDIGVAQLFKDKGIIDHAIYDPTTLVCNSMDLNLYAAQGFKAVSMSNEIPISDVLLASKITKAPIYYQVFGRKMMYYSKRKLVSVYKEFKDIDFCSLNLSMVEEKRDYHIPLYENENGTFCFRHYNISLLKEINNLTFLEYAYFESLNLDINVLFQIIVLFRNVIEGKISVLDGQMQIQQFNLPIEDGFAYEDTVHVKEKIIQ